MDEFERLVKVIESVMWLSEDDEGFGAQFVQVRNYPCQGRSHIEVRKGDLDYEVVVWNDARIVKETFGEVE